MSVKNNSYFDSKYLFDDIDCFTCRFAKRDKHNRFLYRCTGYSNCDYSKFNEKIKLTLEEYINILRRDLKNTNKDYIRGFAEALRLIEIWNEDE